MKINALLILFSSIFISELLYSSSAHATSHQFDLGCPFYISAHVREIEPQGETKGDVLYLHGLGDNSENHEPLFEQWLASGYRIIAVDLPSHGKTTGSSINCFDFEKLGHYLLEVDQRLKPVDIPPRPLLLAGWSTGGLLALRMVQKKMFAEHHRKPSGLILYAPGIGVRPKVGNWWGGITESTLTRNPSPPHHGEIRPSSPYVVPLFALNMLRESWASQLGELPQDLPTQIFLAGDKTDRYVRNDVARAFAEKEFAAGKPVYIVQFEEAFHELDNEPDEVGNCVRNYSVSFARHALEGIALPTYLVRGYSLFSEAR